MCNSNIRAITANDLPALKAIIDSTDMFPSALLDDMISPYLSTPSECQDLWFTYADDTVLSVGYCAPEPMTEGTWNLLLIAVVPQHQGEGIGREMMAYIETRLRKRGERLLLVETSSLDEFAKTRTFYRKCGYHEEARIRDFYETGEDKIVYWKTL